MQISDYIVYYLGSVIPLIFYILCYNRLSETNNKLKLSNFAIVPLIGLAGLMNTLLMIYQL